MDRRAEANGIGVEGKLRKLVPKSIEQTATSAVHDFEVPDEPRRRVGI
jgi:hypothetical protein